MRFLKNMMGSFAIIFIMLFVMTVIIPAPSFAPSTENGSVIDLGLNSWQRGALLVVLLTLTLLIAAKTPRFGVGVWHVRFYLFFVFVSIPLLAVQVYAALEAGRDLRDFVVVALGLWMFVLGGVMCRDLLRPALFLRPKKSG